MTTGIKKTERKYVAISYYELDTWTHRPRFLVLAITRQGESRNAAEELGEKAIADFPTPSDIYNQTLVKNLFVVTESAAKHSYSAAYNHYLMPEYC